MADRSAAQLVEVRLVELKRVDDSYSQDYAKVHERLVRRLEKEAHPLSSDTVSLVSDELVAYFATLAAKNYSPDRLSHMLRVGLGHLCAEYVVVNPHLPQEEVAIRAYAELQRRGWDLATYDPEVAQAALKRMQSLEAARGKSKKPSSSAKAGSVNKKVICNPKIAEAKAKKATPAKKEALMALEKKSSPAKAKKPVATKATAKKSVAKKASAVKAVGAKKESLAKLAQAKKAVAKKTSAAKAVVAKKPATKAAVAKKPSAAKATVAKKPLAAKATATKKAVTKKTVARKPSAAKTAGAKKSAVKKPASEPKSASKSSPMEE
jgi:histone H1/5